MCTHSKYVYNKYTRRKVLVPCGRCEACQQKKAALRANRIRNNVSNGYIALFITLTYKNEFVPYILRDDIENTGKTYLLHRDAKVRRLKSGVFRTYHQHHIIDELYHDAPKDFDKSFLPDLKKMPGKIGVCYYPDIQDFYKRLRLNLLRHYNYNYENKFSMFSCSEYGRISKRPHFHALLFVPEVDVEIFRRAIVESWAYADSDRTARYVQIAKDAASYVAGYVNKYASLPSFFAKGAFRQKHSYSKDFGVRLECFSLSEILERVDRNDLHYYREITKGGKPALASYVVPEYVINRYFPKFKGYFRFTDDEILQLLRVPRIIRNKFVRGFGIQFHESNILYSTGRLKNRDVSIFDWQYQDNLEYTFSDYKKFVVRLNNALEFYIREIGKNIYDFAIDYCRVWRCYHSTVLRDSHQGIEVKSDYLQFYANMYDVAVNNFSAPTLLDDFDISEFELDPNKRVDIVSADFNLIHIYRKSESIKNVSNYALSSLGHPV